MLEESKESQPSEPTGPFLYGDKLTEELMKLQMCSRGDEEYLAECNVSQDEAKTLLNKFKRISKDLETFEATYPETTSSELIGALNVNIPVKKFLTFSLLKLCKRAIKEIDLDLLKCLVE